MSDPKVQEGWKKPLNSGGAPNPQVAQEEIKDKPAIPQLLVSKEGVQAANCRAGPGQANLEAPGPPDPRSRLRWPTACMAPHSVTAFPALLPRGPRVSSPGDPPEPQNTSHGHVLASPMVVIKGFQEQEGLKQCLFIPTRSGKTWAPNFRAEWVFISRDKGTFRTDFWPFVTMFGSN